ncbi:MAG: hypothetical protein H6939_05675 [Burkholderiales bacterium]|nr:hypothetical protein [Burkholderiales bacterium]
MQTFKIHPAIGCARIGNSEEFYLAPEQTGALPIECDAQGREITDPNGAPLRVSQFKESGNPGRIKRQAARFRIFVYDENQLDSRRELKIGDKYQFQLNTSTTGPQLVEGTVVDIAWTVHLANKKRRGTRSAKTTACTVTARIIRCAIPKSPNRTGGGS